MLDLLRIQGFTPPTFDLIGISGEGLNDSEFFLSLIRVTGSGVAPTGQTFDLLRVQGSGLASIVVEPFGSQREVEAFAPVTLTARVEDYVPTSYTWTQVSGPTVTLVPSGASCSFDAPGTLNGGVVLIGVTATLGAQTSVQTRAAIPVKPSTILGRRISDTWSPSGMRIDI